MLSENDPTKHEWIKNLNAVESIGLIKVQIVKQKDRRVYKIETENDGVCVCLC